VSAVFVINIEVDDQSAAQIFTHVLPLCRAHHLTSYDAIYLELAVRRQLPLATLDDALRKAAKKLGVALLGR
jgi:predicted nucleic acid-binding protein